MENIMDDRRSSGLLLKATIFLLGVLQTIITAWAYNISNRVESTSYRMYTVEQQVVNLRDTMNDVKSNVNEVRSDVKLLIRRR